MKGEKLSFWSRAAHNLQHTRSSPLQQLENMGKEWGGQRNFKRGKRRGSWGKIGQNSARHAWEKKKVCKNKKKGKFCFTASPSHWFTWISLHFRAAGKMFPLVHREEKSFALLKVWASLNQWHEKRTTRSAGTLWKLSPAKREREKGRPGRGVETQLNVQLGRTFPARKGTAPDF